MRKNREPKKGTGKHPGKKYGRRLYTDENPKDTVGIKFATPSDARRTVAKVKKIKENYNLNLTASGGVSSIRDIKDLISINCNNCVIGKAIYEKRISLNDLIALC